MKTAALLRSSSLFNDLRRSMARSRSRWMVFGVVSKYIFRISASFSALIVLCLSRRSLGGGGPQGAPKVFHGSGIQHIGRREPRPPGELVRDRFARVAIRADLERVL